MSIIQANQEQFDRLPAAFENAKVARADYMPTEHDALKVMFDAKQRLEELGWRDGIYCPKDGSVFETCEAGSTGIHRAYYEGEWPKGLLWVHDGGDLWPSHPRAVMWRPVAPAALTPPASPMPWSGET